MGVAADPTSKGVLAEEVQLVHKDLSEVKPKLLGGFGAIRTSEQDSLHTKVVVNTQTTEDLFSRMTSSKYLTFRLLPGIEILEARRSILEAVETAHDVVGGLAVVTAVVLCLLKIVFFS